MTQDGRTNIQGLILDMDGVLWRDNQPIGDLPEIFAQIDRRGWRVVLATNNATRSIAQYLDKLHGFGVNLRPEQVINSAQAAAHYLGQQHPQGGPVYLIGEDGLTQALREKGFYHSDCDPLAVVVGMDRQFTYKKMTDGTRLIRAGVPFIGTNPDRTFPTPEGLVPGTGSILAAIEAASYTEPVIVGKPAPEMYRVALERMGIEPSQCLVVGDRLETDIAGAQQIGCPAGLVLSGVTSSEAASSWTPSPDWICQDLTNLLECV